MLPERCLPSVDPEGGRLPVQPSCRSSPQPEVADRTDDAASPVRVTDNRHNGQFVDGSVARRLHMVPASPIQRPGDAHARSDRPRRRTEETHPRRPPARAAADTSTGAPSAGVTHRSATWSSSASRSTRCPTARPADRPAVDLAQRPARPPRPRRRSSAAGDRLDRPAPRPAAAASATRVVAAPAAPAPPAPARPAARPRPPWRRRPTRRPPRG